MAVLSRGDDRMRFGTRKEANEPLEKKQKTDKASWKETFAGHDQNDQLDSYGDMLIFGWSDSKGIDETYTSHGHRIAWDLFAFLQAGEKKEKKEKKKKKEFDTQNLWMKQI